MKNLSSQLSSLKKIFAYGEGVQPTRDWLILSGIAIVLFILSIGWNVWMFAQLENGMSLSSSTRSAPMPSAANSVNAVQSLFQKRATEENHYQTDYRFVDPSLLGG